MKNLLGYYYNIFIEDYKRYNNTFKFRKDGKTYIFEPFDGNITELYNTYLILKKNNKYCHDIVINKDNSIVTMYNNMPYILLKENFEIDKIADIYDIAECDILVGYNGALNWKKLWEERIDYCEYQISQISFKYPKLKESFGYYSGLTETAISLINYANVSNLKYYISHRKIICNQKVSQLFNPLEIIIDSKVRDLAEYIKINYIYEIFDLQEVLSYLKRFDFDNTEAILFLARLLYPSYYFQIYDDVINKKCSEEKIGFIIKKNLDYEDFLKKVYLYYKKLYELPNIEWLN